MSSLLLNVPDELKRLAALGIGAPFLTGLITLHGAGLRHILIRYKTAEARLKAQHALQPAVPAARTTGRFRRTLWVPYGFPLVCTKDRFQTKSHRSVAVSVFAFSPHFSPAS
jgi:hypothetical protein